jgi:DNA-binding response OmpR family regulator
MIADHFRRGGFTIRTGSGWQDIVRHLTTGQVDLVILDLILEDGFDLLRNVRSLSEVPVIIATYRDQASIDRVVAFELGADDIVSRPFDPHELVARVRAIFRRVGFMQNRRKECREYRFAGWHLDCTARRLTGPDGIVIRLTKGEFALLVAFLEAPGRVLSREHLLQATRLHEDVFDRSIDVQVLRLRRKLEQGPGRLIDTERGLGYIFSADLAKPSRPSELALAHQ